MSNINIGRIGIEWDLTLVAGRRAWIERRRGGRASGRLGRI